MYDIIIKNGTIIDGSGKPMYKADIGIKDDIITKIGELHNEKWELEIDAANHLVCPGFIDVNNHSDTYWQIFLNPELESLVYQGVTTIVGGNCGSSLAPLLVPGAIASIQKWTNLKRVNVDWTQMEEFLDVVEKRELSVNFATLVGHGTLRRAIVKDEMRSVDAKELAFLEKALSSSMEEGALGMSSGLIYTHARSASEDELIRLAKIIKKNHGVYVTHIRDEVENFKEAIEEAIKIARESGVKLHISHLKVMGEKNWRLMDEAFFQINHAKEQGVDVTFDVYPYTNTGSVLYTLLPHWVSDGGRKMMLARLKDSSTRARLVEEMRESAFDYSKIVIAISLLNKTMARKKIVEIARSQEKSVEETVVDILIASEGRVITSMEVLSKENVEQAIFHPLSMIATNGSGYNLEHAKSGELVHPRSFGTFPRIFCRYVMGRRMVSWEKAVNKMTSLPAEKFGIKKRGKIEEKYFADIAIIDKDKLQDPATADNPYQYSRGIEFVIVNGKLIVSEGKYTGTRAGRVIKK